MVFLWSEGMGFLVVSRLEYGRALNRAAEQSHTARSPCPRGLQVLTPAMLEIPPARAGDLRLWAEAILRHAGVQEVRVPLLFPHGFASHLISKNIKVELAERPVFPQRAVKNAEEVARIREAQQAAVIGMRVAVKILTEASVDSRGFIKDSGRFLTSERLRHRINCVLLDQGCFCREMIVAGGAQAADPHERGSGPLRANEAIVMDIFPQHVDHGYWGDLTRTVVKGRASTRLRNMHAAVRAAQQAALNQVSPGVKCRTVHEAAVRELRRRGFETRFEKDRSEGFIHSTGHGIGLSVHEAPSVGMAETRLACGQVITVEPGLYYPGFGGLRIEDTVVVVAGGWRSLAPCEKKLEL